MTAGGLVSVVGMSFRPDVERGGLYCTAERMSEEGELSTARRDGEEEMRDCAGRVDLLSFSAGERKGSALEAEHKGNEQGLERGHSLEGETLTAMVTVLEVRLAVAETRLLFADRRGPRSGS